MEVRGLGWVGIRTRRFEETVELFRDVTGLEVIRQERNVVGFRFSDGAEIEVWRPDDEFDEFYTFFGTGPVVGFRVNDFNQARARMEAEGVEFLTPTQCSEAVAWSHFRGQYYRDQETSKNQPRSVFCGPVKSPHHLPLGVC